MSDEAVCRTAPATPGLLITTKQNKNCLTTYFWATILRKTHFMPFFYI